MKTIHGRKAFGFWKGMPYKNITDSFEDFKSFNNTIDKKIVIEHIESLEKLLSRIKETFKGVSEGEIAEKEIALRIAYQCRK